MKQKISRKMRREEDRTFKKVIPAYAMDKITEWERMLEENPESAPRVLEVNWKDQYGLLGGITIEMLPSDED